MIDQFIEGDEILIASTSFDSTETEEAEISAIDPSSGILTLTSDLEYVHYGAASHQITPLGDSLDQRAEVILLRRNIEIKGNSVTQNENDGYGATLLATQEIGAFFTIKTAIVKIDGVRFANMGKRGTKQGAIRFELMTNPANSSLFSNNIIQGSETLSLFVNSIKNFEICNNAFIDSINNGVVFEGANSIVKFTQNVIISVKNQPLLYQNFIGANFYNLAFFTN